MAPSQDTRLSNEHELEDLLSLSSSRNIRDYKRIAHLSVDLGRKEGREWDNKDEAELEALLAQYESLRKESLQTISNRVQILLLGIAAIGALVGGSLTIGNPQASRNIIYAIFSGAIPLVSIFVLFVWAGEAMRSSRVGYFLAADVEARVNQKLGRFIMNWETNLWAGTQKRDEMWGPSMMAFVIVAIIAFASPWCGILLIDINSFARSWLAIAIPYLFLIGAALYLFVNLKRLRNIPDVCSVFLKESFAKGIKMGITQMKIGVTVVGFVLIFLSGYWLRHIGQPFNVAVLTVHKLIALAAIAYLVVTVLRISRIAPLSQAAWIACIAAGLFFLATIASGGWLSAVKSMPAVIRTLHLVLTFLTALSTAAAFYLLLRRE